MARPDNTEGGKMINAPIGDQFHYIVIELAVIIGLLVGWIIIQIKD